jgi:hypothetical protein
MCNHLSIKTNNMKTKLLFATILFFFASKGMAQWEWARCQKLQAEIPGYSHSNSICTSDTGNNYSTGYFTQELFLGNTSISTGDVQSPFITKHNKKGDIIWVKKLQISGPLNSYGAGNGISIDKYENVFTIGNFSGTINIDNVQLTLGGVYIAKFKEGIISWAKKITSNGNIKGKAITTDIQGNIIITGSFSGISTFDNVQLVSLGVADIFIAKYNSIGTLLWVKNAGGSASDQGNSIATDNDGNIFFTGFIGPGNCSFPPLNIFNSSCNSKSGYAFFVAKYDKNGNATWVNFSKSKNCAMPKAVGNGIAVDNSGNCYITGSYSHDALFGSLFCSSANGGYFDEIFIVKYSATGNVEWLQAPKGDINVGLEPYDYGTAITIDKFSGTVLATGVNKSEVEFSPNGQHTNADDLGNIWIAAYTQSGNFKWLNLAYSSADDANISTGISTDKYGSYYLTGSFKEEMLFDKSVTVFFPLTFMVSSFFVAKKQVEYEIPNKKLQQIAALQNASNKNELEVFVYPNPTSEELNIRAVYSHKTTIEIKAINNLGQVVYSNSDKDIVGNYQHTINTKKFVAGNYFLQITNALGQPRVIKFIKQ